MFYSLMSNDTSKSCLRGENHNYKNTSKPNVVAHTLIPALERQRRGRSTIEGENSGEMARTKRHLGDDMRTYCSKIS